jgi:hypothetical protein
MKKEVLTIVGVLAFLFAIGLNVRHALNDYGVKDNKLHVEVLAQSGCGGGDGCGGGSGGSGGSGGGDCGGGGVTVECRTNCDAGGCGASKCSITYVLFGVSVTLSVEAWPGYYACCYANNTLWGKDYYAKTFPISCCN